MTKAVGYDMVDIAGFRRELEARGEPWRDAVYTAAEIAYCEGMRYPARHYAARLAAKTALLKALECRDRTGTLLREAEVARDERGRPYMILHGPLQAHLERAPVRHVLVSLTHTRTLAAAQVMLES